MRPHYRGFAATSRISHAGAGPQPPATLRPVLASGDYKKNERPLLSLGQRHRPRVPLPKLPLMPVGINWRPIAGLVQLRDLVRGQVPTHGLQILPPLLLVPRPDHN